MKYFFIVLFFCFAQMYSNAQTAIVKGNITDTSNHQQLENVVINIINTKDSILYKFTRSKNNGAFTINQVNMGKYTLLIHYPNYADYFDTLNITENKEYNLGAIFLTTKIHLLTEVTIRQKIAAIRMKGDTIVYKVDSFKIADNASVEDLLKKFPGIQVDKNGNITAQGTRVEKVLVDGEEFFGDDPTIATKNLNAKMVNEVQVFDKKTDQATFTGIDDGKTTRTINLKLKEDAKKGWFGKIEASGGFQDAWNNSAMVNSFKKKRKISVYGIASSTGKIGLNWDEVEKYGGGSYNNMDVSNEGYISIDFDSDNDFGNSKYWGEGIPKSWSTGINYSNKYNNDKQNFNGSYRYSKIINNGGGATISQSILPDTLFFNTEKREVYGNKEKNALNGNYTWMIDSLTSVKVNVSGSKGNAITSSNYTSQSLNAINQLVNKSLRNTKFDEDNKNCKTSFLFKKRFKKIGRNLSLNFNQIFNEINTEGNLYALNDFYDKSSINFRSDTTDQKKINANRNNTINSKLAFTESFTKKTSMEFSYAININQYQNKVLSFDKNTAGKYENLNTTFSNHYDFKVVNNTVGTVFKYAPKKIYAAAGGIISFANFSQKDLLKNSTLHYSFTNLFPQATFIYKFNANKRINFSYYGSTQQPTINQIQPLANNNNPLFIQLGNANLKQQFKHEITVRINNFEVLKNRGYYASINYNFVDNAISNSQTTDSIGKTIYQYINTKGNYNFYNYISYNTNIDAIDAQLYLDLDITANKNNNFINGKKNETKNNNYGLRFSIYKFKEKKYDIYLSNRINYTTTTSSIRPDIITQYWTGGFDVDLTITLLKKWNINNSIETNLRQKTELFSGNNNLIVWNSYLSKKILKNEKAEIRLSAFDILNQNRGYERNVSTSTLSENNYQQLSQYFLLGFIWNFSKGAVSAKN